MKVIQQDLMLGNLLLSKTYNKNDYHKYEYSVVKELLFINELIRVYTYRMQCKTQPTSDFKYVIITDDLLKQLKFTEQLEEFDKKYNKKYSIVIMKDHCNILCNNNYIHTVYYFHELQNWFYINCHKFVIKLPNSLYMYDK